MSLEGEIRAAVLAAVRDSVAELRAEIGRPRMLPIKAAPVAYRAILAAEAAGELRVYRIGHASLVDESELYAWIRKAGVRRDRAEAATDEIGELIEMGDRQRRASK